MASKNVCSLLYVTEMTEDTLFDQLHTSQCCHPVPCHVYSQVDSGLVGIIMKYLCLVHVLNNIYIQYCRIWPNKCAPSKKITP